MATKKNTYVLLFLLIGGCTSTTYYNPNINQSLIQTQFTIDNGYCKQVAHGSVPMPAVRVYEPNQSKIYRIEGTFTARGTDGYSTGTYSGTVTETSSNTGGFAEGFQRGLEQGSMIRAIQDQNEVYEGCMFSLGWTTNPDAVPYDPGPVSTRGSTPSIPEKPSDSSYKDHFISAMLSGSDEETVGSETLLGFCLMDNLVRHTAPLFNKNKSAAGLANLAETTLIWMESLSDEEWLKYVVECRNKNQEGIQSAQNRFKKWALSSGAVTD